MNTSLEPNHSATARLSGLAALRYVAALNRVRGHAWILLSLMAWMAVMALLTPGFKTSKSYTLFIALASAQALVLCRSYRRNLAPLRARLGFSNHTPEWVAPVQFLCASVLLATLLSCFVVAPQGISGYSMTPNVLDRDLVVQWRSAYGVPWPLGEGYAIPSKGPRRGDVVGLNFRGKLSLAKRVLAVEGDVFEVRAGQVFINGQALARSAPQAAQIDPIEPGMEIGQFSRFLIEQSGSVSYRVIEQPGHTIPIVPNEHMVARKERWPCTFDGEVLRCQVPPRHVFVAGDNRPVSVDSRALGTIPIDEISGRHVLRINWSRPGPLFTPL